MPLDFQSAAALFMGTEQELARALGISIADLRAARTNPTRVPREVLQNLGKVLVERGSGMRRVGEMLLEES